MLADETGMDVLQVLQDVLNMEGDVRGDEFVCHCINPNHIDESPSFSVNLVTGLCKCFSCQFKGDLISVATTVLGIPRHSAMEQLKPDSTTSILALIKKRMKPESIANRPRLLPGPYDKGPMDYMYDRGFKKKTLSRWQIRFCRKQEIKGESSGWQIRNRIAIPLHDYKGHQLAWVYRATDDSKPKYLYSPGAPISSIWLGYHLLDPSKPVTVVEGSLDAMWLDQCGYQAIAALGANSISDLKICRLKQFSRINILGDRDAAGIKMASKLTEVIGGSCIVSVLRYPSSSKAQDPCELTPDELKYMMRRKTPALLWS